MFNKTQDCRLTREQIHERAEALQAIDTMMKQLGDEILSRFVAPATHLIFPVRSKR